MIFTVFSQGCQVQLRFDSVCNQEGKWWWFWLTYMPHMPLTYANVVGHTEGDSINEITCSSYVTNSTQILLSVYKCLSNYYY